MNILLVILQMLILEILYRSSTNEVQLHKNLSVSTKQPQNQKVLMATEIKFP